MTCFQRFTCLVVASRLGTKVGKHLEIDFGIFMGSADNNKHTTICPKPDKSSWMIKHVAGFSAKLNDKLFSNE